LELLVGVVADATWGQSLTVGFGGVWVDVLRDTSVRLLPVDAADVRSMLAELRGAPLLDGLRGAPAADLDAVVDAILAVARAAESVGERLEALEVNPLRVNGSQVEALDALCTLRAPAPPQT
jgi:acyl-CoA synthetase (NDP forming)